nr:hypothetical protein [uncultured Marvinbryantia sp.]
MIKYVKEIKANIENITSLMVDHMDNDRMELSQKVEDALKQLIRQTLVQRNGDIYVFMTNEEHFNGRYAFGFNQVVDDRPYKAGQNYDITLKILTPNSDEVADDTTMRLLSAQSRCVLVVLPDDRAFLDEIRSSLQIEKFIRFDATNTVTKYEQIKEAKKAKIHSQIEYVMGETSTTQESTMKCRLFLQQNLKSNERSASKRLLRKPPGSWNLQKM